MKRFARAFVRMTLLGAAGCGAGPALAPVASSPPKVAPVSPTASPVSSVVSPASSPGARSAKAPPPGVVAPKTDPVAEQAPLSPSVPPPIPKGTVVLHIGDSFTFAGFAQALRPRFVAVGAKYEVRGEQSSFTTTWSGKLGPLIGSTQPDLVIITLGANEVANTDPPAHAPAVRSIVRQIGGRPCVWVSPPLWAKDTGIIDVLREHSAPCRFFDSDALVKQPIPRQGDKIHPTREGGAIWADVFWDWLGAERAPEGQEVSPRPDGSSTPKRSPWTLRAAPAGEHLPKVLHASVSIP